MQLQPITPGSATCRNGISTIFIRAPIRPRSRTRSVKAESDSEAFEAKYKGKLSDLAANGGLFAAIADYEALGDLEGRIGSFVYLNYVQNTGDPDRAKLLGDTQDVLTRLSTKTLFFGLELNRIEDAVLDKAIETEAELKRYRTWFDELRKAKPYQLEDRVEELFHDKSQTGRGAWNRLFDETMASLKFDVDGEVLGLEPTLTLLTGKDEKKRESAFNGLSTTLKDNQRLFTQITNVLAKDKEISDRWRGFEDVADSRHLANSVEREVVDALETAVRAAYPRLSHRYYAMKAKWFGKDRLNAWDRNAPLPRSDDRDFTWDQAQTIVLDAYGKFSPELVEMAKPFFLERLDRRAGARGQAGRGLRPSDRAERPSLFDAQLYGQGARRHDPGA